MSASPPSWVSLPDMQEKRDECAAVCLNDRFVVIGGHDASEGRVMASCEIYDDVSQKWAFLQTSNSATPRYGCAAAVLKGMWMPIDATYDLCCVIII